ncbi:MAG TPA: hypothetical protein VME41_03415 [Stellaceae bacterium]|nr:hypothetical protein [Stellaceae bacterium]
MVPSPSISGTADEYEPAAEVVRAASAKSMTVLPAQFRERLDGVPHAAAEPSGQPRSLRFALLAATIACAAGVGALAGSLTASGIGHEHVAQVASRTTDSHDVIQALKSQRAEISALKASLDSESRSATAQFGKLADRLNSLEHAQADTAATSARIAEAVDRLDKKGAAAPEITGSISPAAAAAAPKFTAGPVLQDWIVQEVRNGRAIVASRYGSYFLVGAGSPLPGLGRVEEVKRQNGEWIVVTERGLISSNP